MKFIAVALLLGLSHVAYGVKHRNFLSMQVAGGLNLAEASKAKLQAAVKSGQADAIEGLERMIVNLAIERKQHQEDGEPNDAMVAALALIKDAIDNMTSLTQTLHDDQEAACNQSQANMSACDVHYTAATYANCTPNVSIFRNTHKTCREREAELIAENISCHINETALAAEVNTTLTLLTYLNDTSAQGAYEPTSYCSLNVTEQSDPSDLSVVENYLMRMKSKYQDAKKNLTEAEWAYSNKSAEYNAKVQECNLIEGNLTSKSSECTQDQLSFENEACAINDGRATGCAAYDICWNTKKTEHDRLVNESILLEPDLKAKYRALKRIGCFILAFNSSNMSAALQNCVQRTIDLSPMNITCNATLDKTPTDCPTPCVGTPENTTQFAADEYQMHNWSSLVDNCTATCC
eukprot:TRINITY_DN5393_c0_g1_i1.p1 TRINITY_DN5393_c0_g1~~TRINITY_DN5393_c0_g1_i1.p1  ORF type:complete len:407 (+),score=70.06 TRINITY_DN5393_c0_g1_i1:118-1338(+)